MKNNEKVGEQTRIELLHGSQLLGGAHFGILHNRLGLALHVLPHLDRLFALACARLGEFLHRARVDRLHLLLEVLHLGLGNRQLRHIMTLIVFYKPRR